MGLCAVHYLDETLAKLEEFVKSDVFRKSAGLFSIFKVRHLRGRRAPAPPHPSEGNVWLRTWLCSAACGGC